MPLLHICLLGKFRLEYAGDVLTKANTLRRQALLTYLLLHMQAPQSRHHLAFTFWPDSSEKQAHANLRKLLFQLRNALPTPDRFLQQDHLIVQWRPDAPCTVDVVELRHLLTQSAPASNLESLRRIVQLYQGELLPGCYDEWLLPIRQQLQQAVMTTLEQLINLHEHQREYQAGIQYAQRLLGIDPLHEVTYRRLMQLQALNGDRMAALQTYQTCAARLQGELGVEPDAETHALYRHLLIQVSPTALISSKPHFDTPLIGRPREWQTLQIAWRQSQRGQAHFVSISGEAGIGKTRLAEEMIGWANAQGVRTARSRLYEAEGGLAYAPVTEWLRSPTIKPVLKKLDAVWLSEIARLLPELQSEQASLTPPAPMSEAWQRQRFFEALARALLLDQLLLLVIDDLQWCDGETLIWLRFLLRFAQGSPLLIIGTWRSDAVYQSHPLLTLLRDLANANQLTTLELMALSAGETAELAQQIATRQMAAAEMQQLYTVTEGHPLFVIETVRAWDEEGDQLLPPRVGQVIQARLAQLSVEARELVGLAATIGRQFTLEVISHASQHPEEMLVRTLDELWQRRIVREVGVGNYDFSHDRIREVAYQGLSQARRRISHRHVAEALEQVHAHERGKIAGQLAAHFEAARLFDRAITCYQEAASAAFQIYALAEVNNFCRHGLRLLDEHPLLCTDTAREVKLLVMLTTVAAGTQGYGVEEVKALYERALQLSATIEPGAWLVSINYGLWLYYFASAEFDQADRLTEQMPAQAQRLNDPFLLELAHHGRGLTLLFRGESTLALPQLTQSLSFAQSRADRSETFQQSQSLTIMTYAFRALALWLQGYPQQAHISAQEALRRQTAQPTPLNQAGSLTVAAMLYNFMRDQAATVACTQQALAICDQYELSYWRLFAMILHLWAGSAESAAPNQQVDQFTAVLAQITNMGNHAALAYNHRMLSELQAQAGQVDAAIATLRQALAQTEKSGEGWWKAEIYRYLGELLLQTQQVEEAAACLQQALSISQEQGAKSFELRAAVSLARFWQGQTKTEEARTLLAPIYGWFTEGFDTPDLREAQALLAELAL